MLRRLFKLLVWVFFFYATLLQAQGLTELAFLKTIGSVSAVQSTGNFVYFSEIHSSFSYFKRVDISHPTQPVVVDSFKTAGTILDFDINGDYAYLAMADNEFGTRILKIAGSAKIQEALFFEGTEVFGVFYQDNFLYLADGGGLNVYDVSKPDSLKLVWGYHTSSVYGDAIEVFVDKNLIYATVLNTGLFIFNKATRELQDIFPSREIAIGIAANDVYAYISDTARGFIVVEVSDPKHLVTADSLVGSHLGGGITIGGHYAYFADGSNGLRVIDISNPRDIKEVFTFKRNALSTTRVALKGPLVFLASGDFLDIGNIVKGLYILRNDYIIVVEDELTFSPRTYALEQNYPNPFNPETTIEYTLPKPSFVRLVIYDMLGQEVRTLVNEFQQSGVESVIWDGKNNQGQSVPSGHYVYRIIANGFTKSSKSVLLK